MPKKLPVIIKKIRNNPPKPINFGIEKNISFSQLSMYSQCPKKWHLNYVEDHKTSEQSIHMTFGTAMHETIQHYLDVMYDKSGAEADRINTYEFFQNTLRTEYKKQYKANNNQHFSSPDELRKFFDEGIEIIRDFVKNRGKHFSKRGWWLVGCEVPIQLAPDSNRPNVIYKGFLDVVMYHEPTNTFKIIDIKTSRSGWNNKVKKDELKQFQLILYKKFFAIKHGIEPADIETHFILLKRTAKKNHVEFVDVSSGAIKTNNATKLLMLALTNIEKKKAIKNRLSCKRCQFYKTEHCT